MGAENTNGATDLEVATQHECAPPPTGEENKVSPPSKRGSNRKVNFAIFMVLCAAVLAALLVVILPSDDNDNKTDKKKPYIKAFDPDLPVFGADVTRGYDTIEDLEQDLASFAFLTLNQEINGYLNGGGGGGCNGMYFERFDDWEEVDAPTTGDSNGGDGGSKEPNFDGVDSFGTNNQEDSIDTADLTKSDGTFVFASYGDHLVVWNATDGTIVSNIQMPKPDIQDNGNNGGSGSGGGRPVTGVATDIMYYDPNPRIEAILLEGDHLALIVSGYGAEHLSQMDSLPILCNYMGTRIMIYNKNGGNPQFVSQKDIHGSYRQAYSTNSIGHVVTQASIDTWTTLREPIQRWKFPDLKDDEYREEATKIAKELVPKFVASLTKILDPMDLSRLSLFVDSITSEDTLDGIMSQLK
eukprot:scaffold18388_cov137-Cylindrotheca_fusiformis.AAC.1